MSIFWSSRCVSLVFPFISFIRFDCTTSSRSYWLSNAYKKDFHSKHLYIFVEQNVPAVDLVKISHSTETFPRIPQATLSQGSQKNWQKKSKSLVSDQLSLDLLILLNGKRDNILATLWHLIAVGVKLRILGKNPSILFN